MHVQQHTPSSRSTCAPRICLNSCSLARAESTERHGVILGSSSFARKSHASPSQLWIHETATARRTKPTKQKTEKLEFHSLSRQNRKQRRIAFSLRARIDGRRTRGTHYLVHTSTKGSPLGTANSQDVIGRGVERRVQFEERVGRGAIICPMQRLEYLPPTREMINQKGREEIRAKQMVGWEGGREGNVRR